MPAPADEESSHAEAKGRVVRLTGWLVAANALLLLGAGLLPAPVRDAAGRFVAWCGIG